MANAPITPRPHPNSFKSLLAREVVNVVRRRSGPGWKQNERLGVPTEIIRKKAIEWGVTDFSNDWHLTGYPRLTAADKVLLYCFFNLRRHYDELCLVLHDAGRQLQLGRTSPCIVDFGCGPATGALAFASEFPKTRFNYFGVDSALEMRRMGRRLWNASIASGLIHHQATAQFKSSWDKTQLASLSHGDFVLMLLSYFFASPSLTSSVLKSLKAYVDLFQRDSRVSRLVLVYTNSAKSQANDAYIQFKKLFSGPFAKSRPNSMDVEYASMTGIQVVPFLYEVAALK